MGLITSAASSRGPFFWFCTVYIMTILSRSKKCSPCKNACKHKTYWRKMRTAKCRVDMRKKTFKKHYFIVTLINDAGYRVRKTWKIVGKRKRKTKAMLFLQDIHFRFLGILFVGSSKFLNLASNKLRVLSIQAWPRRRLRSFLNLCLFIFFFLFFFTLSAHIIWDSSRSDFSAFTASIW